jgi:predicted RND superfamily exporter protein
MQTNKNDQNINSKKLYIGIGVISVMLIVTVILYTIQRSEMKEVVKEMNIEKQILTEEYQDLALGYDSLESTSDTLNIMLEQEQQKVEHLIEEIKTIKATNASKIREFRKELSTMRGVLKSYVTQIDSLNQINEALKKENTEYQHQYSKIRNSYRELEDVKSDLEGKVEIASRLEAKDIQAEGLNARGRNTNRTNRIDKIEICFTVKKNITAPIGIKPFYLRIERPDGQLLLHSRDDVFEFEGSEIPYSAKRSVEYGGEEMQICIYYNVDMGELMSGEYTADIFADDANIGRLVFELR